MRYLVSIVLLAGCAAVPSPQSEDQRFQLHAARVLDETWQEFPEFAVRNGTPPPRAVATRVLADSAYASAQPAADVRQRYGLGAGPLLCYVGRLDADKFPLDLVEVPADDPGCEIE